MKKKLSFSIILILVLLTSGCNMKYDLIINDRGAKEIITTIVKDTKSNSKQVNQAYKQKQSAYYDFNTGDTYYYNQEKSYDRRNKQIVLKYNYDYFDIEDLQNSNALTQCFYNVSVVKDLQYITISTSKGVGCMSHDGQKIIDQIDASIKTDYKVVKHNADSHKGNNYIWNITENNSNNKSIYIKMDYKRMYTEKEDKKMILAIIGVILGVIVLAVVISKCIKKKKQV